MKSILLSIAIATSPTLSAGRPGTSAEIVKASEIDDFTAAELGALRANCNNPKKTHNIVQKCLNTRIASYIAFYRSIPEGDQHGKKAILNKIMLYETRKLSVGYAMKGKE